MQRGGGGPAPLVLASRIGADLGLLHIFDRQNAVADGIAFQPQQGQGAAAVIADGFVMRRLARITQPSAT